LEALADQATAKHVSADKANKRRQATFKVFTAHEKVAAEKAAEKAGEKELVASGYMSWMQIK